MTGAPQCDRVTATGQDTDNKILIYKIWQKHNIQYRQLCEVWHVQIWIKKNKCVWWINNCIIVLCVLRLMSSVHETDCLGKETVSVSGRSGAQSSVASTRQYQFKEGVCWCEGSRVILPALLLTLDEYNSWRVGGLYNDSLSSPDSPPQSSEVRFGSWAEPDSYWRAEDGFNDGRVELYQQLLWQVELPQLVKEVCLCWALFTFFCSAGPEKLWCLGTWMTPLQSQCCSWWWVGGEHGGFS